jgi:hypothetical protein
VLDAGATVVDGVVVEVVLTATSVRSMGARTCHADAAAVRPTLGNIESRTVRAAVRHTTIAAAHATGPNHLLA